jgi:hypothetical protein
LSISRANSDFNQEAAKMSAQKKLPTPSRLRFREHTAFVFLSLLLGIASEVHAEEAINTPNRDQRVELAPTKELSAFEKSLQMNESLSTRETIVQNGGRKFRRIEINSEIFYLHLQSDLATASELTLLRGENPQEFGSHSPALIMTAVRVTKRTRFFIEGLRLMCLGAQNQSRLGIAPEIAIGFMLDDDPNPNSSLKSRRISINPLSPALNFNADW